MQSLEARLAPVILLCGVLVAGCHRSERTLVIVSNEDSGDLTFIDGDRDVVERTVRVGKRPRGMRVSPDHKTLYVALSGSAKSGPPGARDAGVPAQARESRDESADGIGVVDLDKGTLVKVIASGRDPEAFDITPDGKRLYVSNEETAEVSVVDIAAGTVTKKIAVGSEPEGVTLSADGAFVYVTCEDDAVVNVIQTSTDEVVARLPVGKRPRAVALSNDGARALVTSEGSGVLDVVDTKTRQPVASIHTGGPGARPMGVVVAADGRQAFVSNGREGSITVVDLEHAAVLRSIAGVGARPWGLGLTPDGKKLYVAAGPDVAIVDTGIDEIVKRLPAGAGPWGVVTLVRPR